MIENKLQDKLGTWRMKFKVKFFEIVIDHRLVVDDNVPSTIRIFGFLEWSYGQKPPNQWSMRLYYLEWSFEGYSAQWILMIKVAEEVKGQLGLCFYW